MLNKDNVCVENAGAEQVENEKAGQTAPVVAPKKFKDADALARAYGALEAEFTRRSQRIKELEKQVEVLKSGLDNADGSGAEKLRKNAEMRRNAAKEFDKFVLGLGKVEPAIKQGDAEDSVADEKTMLAETDAAVETVAETETAAEVDEAVDGTLLTTDCVQALDSVVKGAEETAESVFKSETGTKEGIYIDDGEAVKAALEESRKGLSVVGEGEGLSSEELYARVKDDEKVRLQIIGEYLTSLGKNAPPLTAGGAGAMLAPPLRAKSITDAGSLALQYLKKPFEK